MTWPPRNKGSEEKRYDEDEDGSQEEQIKSENNEDGQCQKFLLLCRNEIKYVCGVIGRRL